MTTWLATAQDELEGAALVSLLTDPVASDAILAAAHRSATRLSH